MKQPGERFTPLPSPLRIFVLIIASAFAGELFVMLLLRALLPGERGIAMDIADASLLIILTAPFLWWLVVRPLRRAAVTQAMRAATAMEAAADGILLTRRDGTIISVNPAFSRMTGYSAEEAVGKSPRILKSGQHGPAFYRDMWETILSGRVWRGVVINRRKDGSLYTQEQTISPVPGERGGIECFVATQHDITDRLRVEEALRENDAQLRQAQRMEAVGHLAGSVAHDFNNLLTVILGHCEMLRGRLPKIGAVTKGVEEVTRAAERATSLTRQLLTFSRRQVLEPKVLDLNGILSGVLPMLQRLIGEDIRLTTRLDPHLAHVKTDPSQIEQVIMNLAVNARDAMPRGGRLGIETANVALDEVYAHRHVGVRPGAYVMLAVSDTGVGMSREVQVHIFEPFFTTKERGRGTGLGLATVYGIVKQSGGNIWVYSEPGQGTTFKIYLPRVEAPVEKVAPALAPSTPPRGTETVLLVEDDDRVRAVAREILERHGYTVLQTGHGPEALQLSELHGGEIDLLLTDVVMPQMNGRDLAARVASRNPRLRVLFMSGYTGDAIAHHGVLDVGANFLEKPFTVDTLARKVRMVLDASRD